jgi:photosystem II stability/assembly factor-like uncharacterized protein
MIHSNQVPSGGGPAPLRRTHTAAATLIFVGAALLITPAILRADEPTGELRGLERMGAWFDAHPEYKEMRSSGWKPYNRELWLQEMRPVPEGASLARLRYEAFQIARERSAQSMRRDEPGWFSIGPVEYSGRCLTVDLHPTNPDVVYVGSASGGLWKSTDGGDTWSTSTDDLPTLAIGAVCVLAWDPDVVLIGTGEGSGVGYATAGKGIFGNGILKSTDAGATWNLTSLSYDIPSGYGFNVIEDNPTTRTILAGANDGLWRSTDEGDTWARVAGNGNYFDVKWRPGDPTTVYVAKGRDPFLNFQTSNGIFVSTDDGLNFSLAGTGQPNGSIIAKTKIAVTAADPDYIYAHYVTTSGWRTLGIYRSTDAGQTWQVRNNTINMAGGQGWYNNVIMVDPNNTERVVAGGNILFTSDDGGLTFVALNETIPFGDDVAPHWDNHALAYEPGSNSTLWITTDGGPWRSSDDGATWTRRTHGIVSYQFYDIGVAQSDPLFIMGGTQDNGVPGRLDEDSWFHSTVITDGFVCNIDPKNENVVYSEGQHGTHIKSLDGGQTWFPIQTGIGGSGTWMTPVDLDQNDPNHLYTSTSSGTFRTRNGGSNWELISSHRARWISMNPENGDIVWTVHNSDGVWFSDDDGASWTHSFSFPATTLATKIQADPSDPTSAFVTVAGYSTGGPHILRTTDAGLSWQDVTGDFPDQPANTMIADPLAPSDWYVGADVGVWRSTDGGATWVPYGTGLVNALVTDLEIRRSGRKLVAGTYGRGVFEIDLPLGPSSVELTGNRSPNLMLDPPYPNPVSGRATLRFAARGKAPVSLEVFDVMGRRTSSLVQNGRADGIIRMVSWSAESLPDGVYLVKLRCGGEQVSRKVLVNR